MKDKFLTLASVINRTGINDLLQHLEITDFYIAPASTKYHSSYKGGLLEHSIKVYERLTELAKDKYSQETIAIVSLFHDLCKADYYAIDYRNVKQPDGTWERVPYYTVNDKLPIGNHAEKSIFILQRFIKLSAEEIAAIRYHMGGFQDGDKSGCGASWNKYPLGVMLHIADLQATYLDEVR